ncbi:MAG: transposase, partial [Eubacteriales bacterium]|nr:transposase [Eubacteriales bacterium]
MSNTVSHTPVVFQPLLFSGETKEELSRCCIFPVTDLHEQLAATIMAVEPMLPFSLDSIKQEKRFGRKPYPIHAFFRFQLAMPIFRQSTFKDMRRLLLTDHNLKDLCGFDRIPSEATFSRYLKVLSHNIDMDDHVLGPLSPSILRKREGLSSM